MHVWSQIARLGAFVAAFGPPVLAEAMPTSGFTDQPVAEAVDVDANTPREELANIALPLEVGKGETGRLRLNIIGTFPCRPPSPRTRQRLVHP